MIGPRVRSDPIQRVLADPDPMNRVTTNRARDAAIAVGVLRQFAFPSSVTTLTPLGNRGGFSGARIWRAETKTGHFCLRAWPSGGTLAGRLHFIHRLMQTARGQGLLFVPEICSTSDGATWVEGADRFWDLTTWMPGAADFHNHPTPVRLRAACEALARLHVAWAAMSSRRGPCPAASRRLEAGREFSELVQSGWKPAFAALDPVTPWAERAWRITLERLPSIPALLAPWKVREVALQPCLCDIWHDHVLFQGDVVSGLIDYGAAKIDHVAVDLAHLIGSLVEDDETLRNWGVAAYAAVRPMDGTEIALVDVLDKTGTILAAATWLKWLYLESRVYEDRKAVTQRLATIVERLERRQRSKVTGPM